MRREGQAHKRWKKKKAARTGTDEENQWEGEKWKGYEQKGGDGLEQLEDGGREAGQAEQARDGRGKEGMWG